MPGSSRSSHVAGQHARSTSRRHGLRAIVVLAVIVVVPVIAGVLLGFHSLLLVPIELAAIALTIVLDRRALPLIDRWAAGAAGEEHVGAILDGLRDQGWLAIHDVSSGRGNIDHILVGPAGLFTIETKSRRGSIDPTKIDPAMLRQAYAESKFVENLAGTKVEPVLVFSRAFLIGRGVSHTAGVTVLPARMLVGHLARRRARLTAASVAEVHARLVATLDAH
jgi:hypothetical protein